MAYKWNVYITSFCGFMTLERIDELLTRSREITSCSEFFDFLRDMFMVYNECKTLHPPNDVFSFPCGGDRRKTGDIPAKL